MSADRRDEGWGGGRRSASGCSATRSWARRTRMRYRTLAVHDLAAAARAAARLDRRARRGRGGEAADRYGFERHVTDWRELVADPEVELFDNSGPNNLHAEPTLAAAEAGQARVLREAARAHADESYELWQRVEQAGVKHMTAFNYRFVPAVRLARELIEAGELGEIHHFRGTYLQEWGTTTADVVALRRGGGRLGRAGRPRRARDRPRPLPGRRDRGRLGVDAHVLARARSRRRLRGRGRLRRRRRRDDRGLTIRGGPQERAQLGDQRLEGVARLRPGATQRAAALARARRASARSSSRSPTIRSGSGGGRTDT